MSSRRAGLGSLALLVLSPFLFAQSQAAKGTIEGVVRDTTGAVLPGVAVTVVNLETGAQRSPLTDGSGTYRALLLPLGSYRVKAELFAEAKNLFNVNNVSSVNRIVQVDVLGNPLAPIPGEFPATGGCQQRRIQLGAKLTF